MYACLKDEEANTFSRETVAMEAGSVGDNGERIDATSSPIDDANRNPTWIGNIRLEISRDNSRLLTPRCFSSS